MSSPLEQAWERVSDASSALASAVAVGRDAYGERGEIGPNLWSLIAQRSAWLLHELAELERAVRGAS